MVTSGLGFPVLAASRRERPGDQGFLTGFPAALRELAQAQARRVLGALSPALLPR
jgi:hypothetical protein